MDCYYEADITLKPDPNVFMDSKLKQMLQKNPFLDRDAIIQYYEKSLKKALNKEFIYYCTCEDYYEPVVEDFKIDSAIETWANPYGFDLVYWEDEGNDGGYKPKLW